MRGRRGWSSHSLTVPGEIHRRKGEECADVATTQTLPGGATLLAVADGAGRARCAADAARLAIACVAGAAEGVDPPPRAPGEVVRQAADDILSGAVAAFLRQVREDVDVDAREGDGAAWSTTLAVVVLAGPWLAFAGVGDAFVVAVDRGGVPHLVVPPRPPGTLHNETHFLSVSAVPRFCVLYDPRLAAVILSTDGLDAFIEERVIADAGRSYPVPWRAAPEVFGNIVRDLRGGTTPAALAETLAGAAFQERKGDDIGLAIALR